MRQILYFAAFLIFSISSITLAQRPADKFERRVFHSNNDSIKYALFIPEQVDSANESFPLIFTNGGGLSIGQDDYMFGRMTETWAEDLAQQENPTFVFTAQIPNQSQSLSDYLPNTWVPGVTSIIDSLITEFPIDTSRIYITGASLGALNTWGFIYLSSPYRFAAAIPMSGGWITSGEELQITNIPVWAFCGVSDGNIDGVRDMINIIQNSGYVFKKIFSTYGNVGLTIDEVNTLNANGQKHIYTEFTDGAHEIWSLTYDDPVLHHWLFSQKKDISVNIQSELTTNIPKEHKISQNYPNPFNPSTIIKYSIPKQSNVTLKVFDILGNEVVTLADKEQPQGNYEVEFDGRDLTSGIYIYKLQSGEFVVTKKMILLK